MKRILTFAIGTAVLPALAICQSQEQGKRQFQARCSSCHGDDGTGGGHGPNIVNVSRPRATTQAAMRDLIRTGIAGAGMPGFNLPAAELDSIAAYTLSLFKTPATGAFVAGATTSGDAAAGERFFNGKGNCSSCHMVHGKGGILGPDLSDRKSTRLNSSH